MPLFVMAIALVLSSKGIHLAYIECHAGKVTPSPSPIKILIKIKKKNPLYAKAGVINVKSDQKSRPYARTIFPPYLSARNPLKVIDII